LKEAQVLFSLFANRNNRALFLSFNPKKNEYPLKSAVYSKSA
jgi:hypothetical protein